MKTLKGTARPAREATLTVIAYPAGKPHQPPYLSVEAKAVWDEEYSRVAGCGATEADSSFFGRYCECEAAFRVSALAGELPKAALLTEIRRMAELLGIAGAKSRLHRAGSSPQPSIVSPFAPRRA